jgi:hypothetical protein
MNSQKILNGFKFSHYRSQWDRLLLVASLRWISDTLRSKEAKSTHKILGDIRGISLTLLPQRPIPRTTENAELHSCPRQCPVHDFFRFAQGISIRPHCSMLTSHTDIEIDMLVRFLGWWWARSLLTLPLSQTEHITTLQNNCSLKSKDLNSNITTIK